MLINTYCCARLLEPTEKNFYREVVLGSVGTLEASRELYKTRMSRLCPKLIKPESLGVSPAEGLVKLPGNSSEQPVVTTSALDQCYSKCGPPAGSTGVTWELVTCTLSAPDPDLVSVRICFIKTSGDGCYTAAQAMCVFIYRYCHMATRDGGSSTWWWLYGTVLGTWWVLSLWKLVSFSPSKYSCIISSTISSIFCFWCEAPVSWTLGLMHGS